MYIHAKEYQRTYWPRDNKNPKKIFCDAKNAAAMIATMSAFGVTIAVIIPEKS